MKCASRTPLSSKMDEGNPIAGAGLFPSHAISTLKPSPSRDNLNVPARAARKNSDLPFFYRFLSHGRLVLVALLPFIPEQFAQGEPPRTVDKEVRQTDKQVRTDLYGDPLPPGAIARLGTVRFRHGSTVKFVGFSPDGKMLVSAGADATIRVWEAASGKLLRKDAVDYHDLHSFTPLALSPGGKILAFGVGSRIRFWDVTAGRNTREIVNDEDQMRATSVGALGFSPDGKTLATVDWPGKTLRLWETATGRKLLTIERPEQTFSSVAFAHDGKTLASGRAGLWQTATGNELGPPLTRAEVSAPVVFSPDDKVLAVGAEEAILLADVATGKRLHELRGHTGPVSSLVFTRDGKTLISGAHDYGTIRFWDVASGKEQRQLSRCRGFVESLALSADGEVLAVAAEPGLVRLWNVRTGLEQLRDYAPYREIRGVAWSPDGRCLATVGDDRTIRLWDAATGRQLRDLTPQPDWWSCGVVFSPDGRCVISAGGNDDEIVVVDVVTGNCMRRFRGHQRPVQVFALSLDGRTLASADKAHTLRLWDAATGKSLLQRQGKYSFFAISADCKLLAVAATIPGPPNRPEHLIRLWDGTTGQETLTLNADAPIGSLCFSPDGSTLAAGYYYDGGITLWDTLTGQQIRGLAGHPFSASRLTFSPDGRILASAGPLGATATGFRLWDVVAGQQLGEAATGGGGITRQAFSPDGKALATGLLEGSTLVWDLGALRQPPRRPQPDLTAKRFQDLWESLEGSSDGDTAHRAIWALADAGVKALPFLRDRLRPVPAPDLRRLRQLIVELDHKEFAAREAASKALETLGTGAEPILRETLAGKPSLEARRRIEALLATPWFDRSPDVLCRVRAVQALERVGSAEARGLLKVVAEGPASEREAQAAKDALRRLNCRVLSSR